MNRRLIRTLVYVLVAGQLLLWAPLASALEPGASAASAEMPCEDSMPQTDDSKPCPCCPDGATTMAACFSACSSSAAGLPTFGVQIVQRTALPAPAFPFTRFADHSDPPLNPPPIV